jgi:hypothetical protein
VAASVSSSFGSAEANDFEALADFLSEMKRVVLF